MGFSIGVLDVPLGPALAYIALQALAVTFAGLWLGGRLGRSFGERAELASGAILVLLGLGLLAERVL